MIRFSCPECDAELEASNQKAGNTIKCSECGESVDVPQSAKQGVGATLWMLFVGVWSVALALAVILLVQTRGEGQSDNPSPQVVDNNGGDHSPETGRNSSKQELPAATDVPGLIQGLEKETDGKENASYRARCAAALGALGQAAQPAIPALVGRLSDPDVGVRQASIDALNKIGPPTKNEVPELVKALSSHASEARIYCANALAKIGPDGRTAAAALIEAAKDKDSNLLRREAFLALGKVAPGDRALLWPVILIGSKDTDPNVRGAAVSLLPTLAPVTANDVPTLAAALAEPNPPVHLHAAQGLLRLGAQAKGAVKALDQALLSPDKQLATIAAQALAAIGPDGSSAEANLYKAAEDDNEQLSRAAVDTLIKLGIVTKKNVPGLTKMLSDKRSHTRISAILLLEKLGPDAKDAAPYIAEVMLKSDEEKAVRIEAARALGAFAQSYPDAIPKLIDMVKLETDVDLRIAACGALTKIGPDAKEAVTVLEPLVKKNEKDKKLLGEAVATLAAIAPDEKVARELEKLVLLADNVSLRPKIFAALTKMGKPALPSLGELLTHLTDKDIRLAAAVALGTIGPDVKTNPTTLYILKVRAGVVGPGDPDGDVKNACKNALGKVGA